MKKKKKKKNASSADEMGLDKVGMHHFSTLDAVGSHLHVADRSICDQDQNVVITKPGHSTLKYFVRQNTTLL